MQIAQHVAQAGEALERAELEDLVEQERAGSPPAVRAPVEERERRVERRARRPARSAATSAPGTATPRSTARRKRSGVVARARRRCTGSRSRPEPLAQLRGAAWCGRCRSRRAARESATATRRAPRCTRRSSAGRGSHHAPLVAHASESARRARVGGGDRLGIAGVGVAHHADARVARQHALEPLVGVGACRRRRSPCRRAASSRCRRRRRGGPTPRSRRSTR